MSQYQKVRQLYVAAQAQTARKKQEEEMEKEFEEQLEALRLLTEDAGSPGLDDERSGASLAETAQTARAVADFGG